MQIIKKIFLAMLILFNSSSYIYTCEPITISIAIATGIAALCQMYFLGDNIHEKVCPSAQNQVNDLVAQEKLEYMHAKNNFKKCLSGTTSATKRNDRNIPTPCQELASIFIKYGGKNEMIEMMQNFDDSQE